MDELEQKARDMGWMPKEDFKGDPEKWIPADQYVDRGEHLMPILHATNKRLKEQVEAQARQLSEINSALNQSRETIAALETYHEEDVKQKVEKARTDLREQLKKASAEGDHEGVARITEEMTNLKTASDEDAERRLEEENKEKAQRAAPPKDYTKEPAFIAWQSDNPWFGTDMVRTAIANAVSYKVGPELRAAGVIGRPYLDRISEEVEKEIAKLSGGRSSSSKVEAGGPTDGGKPRGGNGKGYNELPAEAKAACDSFEKQLVGPNKLHKTRDDWRKKYAERYFTEV